MDSFEEKRVRKDERKGRDAYLGNVQDSTLTCRKASADWKAAVRPHLKGFYEEGSGETLRLYWTKDRPLRSSFPE